MINNNENRINIRQVIMLGGSLAAFEIGSAFATGAESLQFFCSWGGCWPWIITVICFIIGTLICATVYTSSSEHKFKDANELYYHYFGKYVGKAIDIYVHLCLIAYVLAMTAGSGATLNQYFGISPIIGTVGMAVITAASACLGLRKLIDILGSLGILIVIVVCAVAVYTFITSDVSAIEGSRNVLQYVDEGKVLQAGAFGIHNPLLAAFLDVGSFIMCGIPWMTTLGLVIKNTRTAVATGFTSSGFFFLGCIVVSYILLVNMDLVAGHEIPVLAAMQEMLPRFAGVYTIIIVLGIYTTVSGELFVLGDRFSYGNNKLRYGIIAGTVIFAIIGSSFIPFSVLVNVLYGVMGFIGVAFGIVLIIKFFVERRKA